LLVALPGIIALIDIVVLKTLDLFEFLLQHPGQFVSLLLKLFVLILQILLDDQPADVSCARQLENFVRRIRVDRVIEEEHRKLWTAARGVIKEIFTWNYQDAFVAGNFAFGVTNQLFKIRQPIASNRKAFQRRQGRSRQRAIVEIRIIQTLVRPNIEPA